MWQSAKPRIDDTYIAVAAKLNNLPDELDHDPFLGGNIPQLLYFFQFLFPPLIFLLAVFYIWWSYKSIQKYVEKQNRHTKNWAAIFAYAVMCWTFVGYVVALDAAAVAYRDHHIMPEYFTDNLLYQYPLMPLVVWDVVALLFLLLFTIPVIVFLLYIEWEQCKEKSLYFLMILFGIAPLLCLASHAHYIAIAWITDPVYSGAIGIYYGILIFMWFFLLKQAYAKDCFGKTVCQMSIAWLTIVGLQLLTSFFFVYIPVKHSIENTPTFLYAVVSGSGVLLLLLIAYKVIHDPRGTLSISGIIQNILHKMEDENLQLTNINNWDDLDDEEKFTELVYHHYGFEKKCDTRTSTTPIYGTNATSSLQDDATSSSRAAASSSSRAAATSSSRAAATSSSRAAATSMSHLSSSTPLHT